MKMRAAREDFAEVIARASETPVERSSSQRRLRVP